MDNYESALHSKIRTSTMTFFYTQSIESKTSIGSLKKWTKSRMFTDHHINESEFKLEVNSSLI